MLPALVQPTRMSVADWMKRRPTVTRWPWLGYRLAPRNDSYTAGPACLNCRRSTSSGRDPCNADEVDAHPNAAHPDDLADEVDQRVAVQEVPSLLGQRGAIAGEDLLDEWPVDAVLTNPERGRLDQTDFTGHLLGELPRSTQIGSSAGAPVDPRRDVGAFVGDDNVEQIVGRDLVVPDVQEPLIRILRDPRPVRLERSTHRPITRCTLEVLVAGQHVEAGHHALEVPLERTRQRLIEVAQVERQPSFRRRPQPEVEHVRVTAQLHHQAAVRTRGEIGGHHRRGTPVEGPR